MHIGSCEESRRANDEEFSSTGNSKVVEGDAIAKMWCLVSQANSVILEVQVDPKAIGQECLEKVSALLFLVDNGQIGIMTLCMYVCRVT